MIHALPDFIARGGPVLWLIIVVSAVGAIVFLERLFHLHRSQIRAKEFMDGIKNALAKRRLVEALTLCEETPGPVAALVKAALLHCKDGEARMRFAIQEAAIIEVPVLERRLGAITAVAQAAPLLGLLGTILGLVSTLAAFSAGASYATPSSVAAGVWQALITTAAGLIVAIPAHFCHHFLCSRVKSILHDMEWASNEILVYILKELPGRMDGAVQPGGGTEGRSQPAEGRKDGAHE